jgi:hypothetical protein
VRTPVAAVAFLLLASGPAVAADPGNRAPVKDVPHRTPPPAAPREIGETVDDAIPIWYLPFTATGNTCGFADDYDEVCPYSGSTSPDVVYSFTPPHETLVDISLCTSGYDTKLYVWENEVSNLVACNDDACGPDGFRSALEVVFLEPGNTYYIVVDGYGGFCGDYELEITEWYIEILHCPADAFLEGEPECSDGYVDAYNGGCNSVPPVFTELYGTPGGDRFDVCGTSGTYEFDSMSYRDTDWYLLHVAEESTITFGCSAMFPFRNFLIDASAGCDPPLVLETVTGDMFPDYAEITYTCPPGDYWYWVGPQIFTGVECGALYAFSVEGYVAAPLAAERMTWGGMKALYR